MVHRTDFRLFFRYVLFTGPVENLSYPTSDVLLLLGHSMGSSNNVYVYYMYIR